MAGHVTLRPSPAPPRRLSAAGRRPPPPLIAALHGHLITAHKATSAATVAPFLGPHQTLGWELFAPLERVLLVAVVAAANQRSERSRTIRKLKRSLRFRDEVIGSMQEKLDEIVLQMNGLRDQSMKCRSIIGPLIERDCVFDQKFCGEGESKLFEVNSNMGIDARDEDFSKNVKVNCGKQDDVVESVEIEREERRMSALSDFNWSVVSSVDFQLNTLAAEQEFYNLQRERDEKDAMIKELTEAVHASNVAESKRITELENIIRTKNTAISKLKNDMMHLEQQVIELTRLRRSSSITLKPIGTHPPSAPLMVDNILYDMSATSPSSSDPESPITSRKSQRRGPVKDFQQTSIVSTEREPSNSSNMSVKSAARQQSVCSKSNKVQKIEPTARPRQRQSVNPNKDSTKIRSQEKKINTRRWS